MRSTGTSPAQGEALRERRKALAAVPAREMLDRDLDRHGRSGCWKAACDEVLLHVNGDPRQWKRGAYGPPEVTHQCPPDGGA